MFSSAPKLTGARSLLPPLIALFLSVPPQASHKESEEALQKRLEEVTRELCRAQTSHASLRADAEKAQEQQQRVAGEFSVCGSFWMIFPDESSQ